MSLNLVGLLNPTASTSYPFFLAVEVFNIFNKRHHHAVIKETHTSDIVKDKEGESIKRRFVSNIHNEVEHYSSIHVFSFISNFSGTIYTSFNHSHSIMLFQWSTLLYISFKASLVEGLTKILFVS